MIFVRDNGRMSNRKRLLGIQSLMAEESQNIITSEIQSQIR
jgi:hypothetical protein